MRQLKTRMIATCAAVLLGATFAAAQGLDTNRTTIVTFSAPVALPGVTLPAGSYMFRLADSQTNRNIVQVFDKDRTKIYATILAMPAQRPRPADETVITFKETPANAAPAVQYWYYPGETMGQEFAYPKKQAMEIANASHTGVLSVDQENDKYDASKAGDVTRVQPGDMADTSASSSASQSAASQSAASSTPQSAQANQPSSTDASASANSTQPQRSSDMPSAKPEASQSTQPSASAAVTQNEQPSSREHQAAGTSGTAATDMPAGHMAHGVGTSGTSNADATTGTSGRRALPHTASSLPLLGFAGLLAILGAASVRAFRKATV